MTYQSWLFDWLENYIKPSVKVRTYERYAQICALHIIPSLGGCELCEISVLTLQKFVTALLTCGNRKTGKGLSVSFVNTVISLLQSSLKTACMIGMTRDYVANKIKRPKKAKKHLGVILCLYTGVRIGELLALTWEDVDLEKGILTVSKTCYDKTVGQSRIRMIDSRP